MTDRQVSDPDPITVQDDILVPVESDTATDDALVTDVLVEEVSIDGMCGVY